MPAPYRNDADALEARHSLLSEELSSVKAKTRELSELQKKEAHLERDLADVERKLDGMGARRSLPLLDRVSIASPCTASWDEMAGDDRVRFCASCQKDVYNLSGMDRPEAERLVRERSSDICVRLYKRTDGTVLTADCPVGVKSKRRRRIAAAVVTGGMAAAGAMYLAAAQVTMGKMAASPPPEPTGEAMMGLMEIEPTAAPEVKPPPPPQKPLMGKPSMQKMGRMRVDASPPAPVKATPKLKNP